MAIPVMPRTLCFLDNRCQAMAYWQREIRLPLLSFHTAVKGELMAKVTVFVTLKPTLLDTQGRTVENAVHHLGYSDVTDVRIGKVIEMEVAAEGAEAARSRAAALCDKLLANPVTESYRIEVDG